MLRDVIPIDLVLSFQYDIFLPTLGVTITGQAELSQVHYPKNENRLFSKDVTNGYPNQQKLMLFNVRLWRP